MWYILIFRYSRFSYTLSNCHIVTIVSGEASLKTDRTSPRNVVYIRRKKPKVYEFKCHTPSSEQCKIVSVFLAVGTQICQA